MPAKGQMTLCNSLIIRLNKKSCLVVLHRPPTPNFWKLEKKFLLYKSIPHLMFRIPQEVFFSLRILIF